MMKGFSSRIFNSHRNCLQISFNSVLSIELSLQYFAVERPVGPGQRQSNVEREL